MARLRFRPLLKRLIRLRLHINRPTFGTGQLVAGRQTRNDVILLSRSHQRRQRPNLSQLPSRYGSSNFVGPVQS